MDHGERRLAGTTIPPGMWLLRPCRPVKVCMSITQSVLHGIIGIVAHDATSTASGIQSPTTRPHTVESASGSMFAKATRKDEHDICLMCPPRQMHLLCR